MVLCFEVQCKHNNESNTCGMHRFPKDWNSQDVHQGWRIAANRRKDRQPTTNDRLCSCHFETKPRRGQKGGPTIFNGKRIVTLQTDFPEPESKRVAPWCELDLSSVDIVLKMKPALCTASTSTEGADVPMPIKHEPDVGSPAILHPDHSDEMFSDQKHLADQKFCKLEDCKDDIPIINIAPIVTSSSCSIKSEEDNLTVKSELDDQCNSSGTSNPTSVKCEVVPNVVLNLYEVKNEIPCPIHTKIVHNNRLAVGSKLVEVKGELDCKPEIVGNVNNFGDVNIQTNVQHNSTVNQKLFASTSNCDIEIKEETALSLNSRTSCTMITSDEDDNTDPDVDDENPSHRGSDVQPTNCSNVNKQLSTQDDVIVNVHENTNDTNEDHNSVLCDKELCEGTIKSFSCTRCEMSFTSMEEFTSHCETHNTAATHKCHICEKTFESKFELTIHLRIHSGGKPFKSSVCGVRFTQKVHLTSHLRVHSGEPPFKCNICDKKFNLRSSLKGHLSIHSGERPFRCDVCDTTFAWKNALKNDLRRHSDGNPFKCKFCGKCFTLSHDLKKHVIKHTDEHALQCNVCDKYFAYKGESSAGTQW